MQVVDLHTASVILYNVNMEMPYDGVTRQVRQFIDKKGTLEDAVSVGDFDSKMTHSRPIHSCLANRRDLFRLFTKAFTLFTKAAPSMYNLISEATYFTNVLSSTQGLGFRLEI